MEKPRCPQCDSADIALVTYHQVTDVAESGKIKKSKEAEDAHFLCYACDTEFEIDTLLEATFGGDPDDSEGDEEEEYASAV